MWLVSRRRTALSSASVEVVSEERLATLDRATGRSEASARPFDHAGRDARPGEPGRRSRHRRALARTSLDHGQDEGAVPPRRDQEVLVHLSRDEDPAEQASVAVSMTKTRAVMGRGSKWGNGAASRQQSEVRGSQGETGVYMVFFRPAVYVTVAKLCTKRPPPTRALWQGSHRLRVHGARCARPRR